MKLIITNIFHDMPKLKYRYNMILKSISIIFYFKQLCAFVNFSKQSLFTGVKLTFVQLDG